MANKAAAMTVTLRMAGNVSRAGAGRERRPARPSPVANRAHGGGVVAIACAHANADAHAHWKL